MARTLERAHSASLMGSSGRHLMPLSKTSGKGSQVECALAGARFFSINGDGYRGGVAD